MRAVIEIGLLGDNIVQMGVQSQCLLVALSDMQGNVRIVVLARLLCRSLQQERADSFVFPMFDDSERINIPFVVLRPPFEPASDSGIESCLISSSKAQNQSDNL